MIKETIDDKDYIKSLLDECIKITNNNSVFYITSDNIIRQLKYNKILNKKEIKINYNEIVILEIYDNKITKKEIWINYHKIWIFFNSKYKFIFTYMDEIVLLVKTLLCDLLELDINNTFIRFQNPKWRLNDMLNKK